MTPSRVTRTTEPSFSSRMGTAVAYQGAVAPTLPIDAHLPAIRRAIDARGAAVIVAEPGAGKTTRVPPLLLEATEGEVLVLEPRRMAARLAARRVASERGGKVGDEIGYRVRFDSNTSNATRLVFLTEGIFIRRLVSDPELRGVGAVIFDEVHERHLHTDLALGMVQRLRATRRPDLIAVAMSATLDAGPLSAYLDAESFDVEGRQHPVTIEHAGGETREPLERRVASAVGARIRDGLDGDVLVFLPGAREIGRAQQSCQDRCKKAGVDVAILHGSLGVDAQDRVVRPANRPRVILSTNVAESSLTLPQVTTVIDSGLAREPDFSPFTGLPSLTVTRVSQASAVQRAGRAGRVREGRCIRLFTEADFRSRPERTPPELLRADLSELVLFLRANGEDPRVFPFLDRPPATALEAAEQLLRRLGALEGDEATARGRQMLALPAHPRLGRLIAEGLARDVGARACLLAAILAERPPGRHVELDLSTADALAWVDAIERAEEERLRDRELRARGFDPGALAQLRRATQQLKKAARAPRDASAPLVDEDEDLRLCLLAAFPDRVAERRSEGSDELRFQDGGGATLAPSCVVREGRLLVAVDATDASEKGRGRRVIVRSAAEIEPEHLLEVAAEGLDEIEEHVFDESTGTVIRRRALAYGAIMLDESVSHEVEGEDAARALAEAAKTRDLANFFDMDALEGLKQRVRFANAHGLELPPVNDTMVDRALTDLCLVSRSLADLRKSSLTDALWNHLGHEHRPVLDRIAPEAVALPGRKRVPVSYEADRDPWIASRLQDFFGMKDGPRVADGKVPLVLHLLAPNRRAVQVTTDLAGFWERAYQEQRRALMRRYSKHSWPEDPANAEPPPRRGRRR